MHYSNVTEIFKIGIGPSSSHTMGPWLICLDALKRFENDHSLKEIQLLHIHLYGSLAKTGEGHCTPMGCIMGLSGYIPKETNPNDIDNLLKKIDEKKNISLLSKHSINFNKKDNILFHKNEFLKHHSNGMKIDITYQNNQKISWIYYSIGGGFFIKEEDIKNKKEKEKSKISYPHDFSYAQKYIDLSKKTKKDLYEILLQNEFIVHNEVTFKKYVDSIVDTMLNSTYRGITKEGYLPGYLKVKRRAKKLYDGLTNSQNPKNINDFHEIIKNSNNDFQKTLKWISCFAISVNEENADTGKIVTAPTNGAAGVIPSVLHYYLYLVEPEKEKNIYRFITIASLIGSLFRARATISAAEGGCQAEIGVSSSMAAAALTDALGGCIEQTFEAAEITMEHHLGLTCDPVGGLVQIPCIERNAIGAVKAITSSQLALSRDMKNVNVSLDQVIDAMWETSQSLNQKYKETSEGGLAIFVNHC